MRCKRGPPALVAARVGLLLVGFALPSWAQTSPLTFDESEPSAVTSADGESSETAFQRFRRAQNLFEFGDCPKALDELAGLDEPRVLKDEKQLLEVYRMTGICLALADDLKGAETQFERLLHLSPENELDPFRTPPPVMELFENTKKRIREEMERLQIAQRLQEKESPESLRVIWVERELERQKTPFATVFLPLGLAQWANGQETRAMVIGGAQLAALAANVGSYWAMQVLKSRSTPSAAELDTYRRLQTIQAGALIACLGIYFYGVGDAWWNHEPQHKEIIREERKELVGESARESLRRLAP